MTTFFFFFKRCRNILQLIVLQRAVGIAAQRMQKTPLVWGWNGSAHIPSVSLSVCSTKCSWLPLLFGLQDGVWVRADIHLSVLVFSHCLLLFIFLQKYNPVRIEWNTLKAGFFFFSTDHVPKSLCSDPQSLPIQRIQVNKHLWCKTSRISIPKLMY